MHLKIVIRAIKSIYINDINPIGVGFKRRTKQSVQFFFFNEKLFISKLALRIEIKKIFYLTKKK